MLTHNCRHCHSDLWFVMLEFITVSWFCWINTVLLSSPFPKISKSFCRSAHRTFFFFFNFHNKQCFNLSSNNLLEGPVCGATFLVHSLLTTDLLLFCFLFFLLTKCVEKQGNLQLDHLILVSHLGLQVSYVSC